MHRRWSSTWVRPAGQAAGRGGQGRGFSNTLSARLVAALAPLGQEPFQLRAELVRGRQRPGVSGEQVGAAAGDVRVVLLLQRLHDRANLVGLADLLIHVGANPVGGGPRRRAAPPGGPARGRRAAGTVCRPCPAVPAAGAAGARSAPSGPRRTAWAGGARGSGSPGRGRTTRPGPGRRRRPGTPRRAGRRRPRPRSPPWPPPTPARPPPAAPPATPSP